MQQAQQSHTGHTLWMPKDVERSFLTAREVASYCAVPVEEVLGWIDTRLLKASCANHSSYRVSVGDFVAFIAKFEVCI